MITQWPRHSAGLAHYGLVRRYPVDTSIEKHFCSTNRFRVLRGHDYFIDGEVIFPDHDYKLTPYLTYRTHYGWSFAHDGIIYAKTDRNMRFALRRILGAREPPDSLEWDEFKRASSEEEITLAIQSYDALLRRNQKFLICNRKEEIAECFYSSFGVPYFEMDKVDAAVELSKMKHNKQQLRIRDILDRYKNGQVGMASWLEYVLLKMKPDEIAKPGKYGRMIVDLGVGASLEAGLWADAMKHHFEDKPFLYKDSACYFCSSPDPVKVQKYFDMMHTHSYHVLMVVFSDDAIVSIQTTPGNYFVFNLDISSCDTSHTPDLFELLFDIMCCPPDIRDALHHQIMSNMIIHSRSGKKVVLQPLEYYLQSGITITTLINSFSQFLMLMAITDSNCTTAEEVILACGQAGYKVTIDECLKYEDLQFLKMSPTLSTDGNWYATLNLGVILRASGTCRGDIPTHKKGQSLARSAEIFQSQLMSGLLSGIDHPTLNLLAPCGVNRSEENYALAAKHVDALAFVNHRSVPHKFDDRIFNRYDLDSVDIQELKSLISDSAYGTCAYSVAASKILTKDYALKTPLA